LQRSSMNRNANCCADTFIASAIFNEHELFQTIFFVIL
jgi:hypothetical protein